MHENDDELSAIRQHLSQTSTECVGALAGKGAEVGAGALAGEGALPGALTGADADESAIPATSIHEDDEVFEKQQDLSAGLDKRPYEVADKSALLEALAGAGAIAGAVEGTLSATSVHEDDELSLIRQHLSHAPTSSILPVLSRPAVS